MQLQQELGRQHSGETTFHQQFADPIKQRWSIVHLRKPLFKCFEFLRVLTTPQSIDQRVLGRLASQRGPDHRILLHLYAC